MKKISDYVSLEMGKDEINIRILKPFAKFYNKMISIAFKYGIFNLCTVNHSDFVEALIHSMKGLWLESLRIPAITFYKICKEEGAKEKDVSLVLENIRYRMKKLWDEQIIEKSTNFKKAKIEPY